MAINNKNPTKDITLDDIKNKIPLSTKKRTKKIIYNGKNIFSEQIIPIIAGPNGTESKELLFKTAKLLHKNKLKYFRVHMFKPLTFPYRSSQYSESGIKALNWIKEIKKEFNFIFIAEITEIQYLEPMIDVIDILQIGTRNMQNFELLRECARSKRPLILKRHHGASIRDLLGAAEHILLEGNNNLILCERGISAPHTHRNTSRFILDLQAVCALKELTSMPIISDPSHASFWAPWVPNLAKASISAGADGLIIETHPNPSKSKVDPLQPLNFNQFSNLITKLRKYAKIEGKKIV